MIEQYRHAIKKWLIKYEGKLIAGIFITVLAGLLCGIYCPGGE